MTSIRVHYFESRGRAEVIRLILHYNNVKFEDIRIPKDTWPEKKGNYKYGQVPALEVDCKFLYQTNAIVRYLAKQYNLAGKDAWEQAKIDELHELLQEFYKEIREYTMVLHGMASGDKDKLYAEKFIPAAKKYLPFFEQALLEAGSGFYAKSGITYFDFVVFEAASRIAKDEPELAKEFPLFVKNGHKFHEIPELQDYLSTRT
ncbi:CRE-GST-7 protein [Aphelenchoides bicaudatus]|nr:CRE-GST-7 protein [Aphelenchoides bicaudatus]